MSADGEILELIRSGPVMAAVLRSAAEKMGMVGLLTDGAGKVLAGLTSLDEIMNLAMAAE